MLISELEAGYRAFWKRIRHSFECIDIVCFLINPNWGDSDMTAQEPNKLQQIVNSISSVLDVINRALDAALNDPAALTQANEQIEALKRQIAQQDEQAALLLEPLLIKAQWVGAKAAKSAPPETPFPIPENPTEPPPVDVVSPLPVDESEEEPEEDEEEL